MEDSIFPRRRQDLHLSAQSVVTNEQETQTSTLACKQYKVKHPELDGSPRIPASLRRMQ